MPPAAATPASLAADLRALGVRPGGVLLVHSSFRAVRPVEGGPRGLIEGLLQAIGPQGTLVMPSWAGDDDAVFDPAASPVTPDLGVVAEAFRHVPGVLRADHPASFAALGPRAAEILRDPLPLPPHIPASPVGRVHDLDGQVLLLGVGHDANSTVHLAELTAGVPYGIPHHVTVLRDGLPVRVDYLENDHCCERFALLDAPLRTAGRQAEGRVGAAHARLVASRDVMAAALRLLTADPLVFLHGPEDGCEECDAARASVAG